MKKIVLDTGILVSALWSKDGKPAYIVRKVIEDVYTACYDHRIMDEYLEVLYRPRFSFKPADIRDLLNGIEKNGISVVAPEVSIAFIDEDDRMFYEVAKFCDAVLITGNKQHFPDEPDIMTVSDFFRIYDLETHNIFEQNFQN